MVIITQEMIGESLIMHIWKQERDYTSTWDFLLVFDLHPLHHPLLSKQPTMKKIFLKWWNSLVTKVNFQFCLSFSFLYSHGNDALSLYPTLVIYLNNEFLLRIIFFHFRCFCITILPHKSGIETEGQGQPRFCSCVSESPSPYQAPLKRQLHHKRCLGLGWHSEPK